MESIKVSETVEEEENGGLAIGLKLSFVEQEKKDKEQKMSDQ